MESDTQFLERRLKIKGNRDRVWMIKKNLGGGKMDCGTQRDGAFFGGFPGDQPFRLGKSRAATRIQKKLLGVLNET